MNFKLIEDIERNGNDGIGKQNDYQVICLLTGAEEQILVTEQFIEQKMT